MSNKRKLFVGNLAIDIVKFPDFRLYPYDLLRFYALIKTDSLYSKTYRSILISDIPGHYEKNIKQYLEVKYTLRGKQEVLKNLPVGAYPIIYKNQNETWIAISEETKYVSAVITDLGEIDKKFPSTIFDLAFLIVNSNDVEYWEVETLYNREFPVYFRCGENCYWMPLGVLTVIKELFVKIMEDENLLRKIQLAKAAQMALGDLKKGLNYGPTTYDKLDEIKKRLNSEEYINEIMSTLEKLERESQEYKLFNEEAKNYHYFILEDKHRYLAEAKNKARVYFKPSETFKREKDLPEGIYLLVSKNIQDGKTYYVKDEGDGWSVVEITESSIIPTVLFELAYVIKLGDVRLFAITKLPNRKFYLYLFCGLDKPCNWMPPVVFNAIWPVVRKHIKKIMQEVLNVGEEKKEEIKEEKPQEEKPQEEEIRKEKAKRQLEEIKFFDSELAIEIAKSDVFRDFLLRYLRYNAFVDNRSPYVSVYRYILASNVPGQYLKNINHYLEVRYILRSKQEVLKHLPVGAYPIIYKNQNETRIAINIGNKFFAAVITNLDKKIDAKIPSMFNLAFLIVHPNDVEYLEVEPENRDFPIYARCEENCRWMPSQVLKIIIDLFDDIMNDKKLLRKVKAKPTRDEIDEIIDEIEKRLNSEEYINEIMSALEKLVNENQEYKLFNEEAKSYHYYLLLNKRGYLTEVRKKTRVYFKSEETFKDIEEAIEKLPNGIYLLVFRDLRATSGYDYRTYFVKDNGNNWSIFKIEDNKGVWTIPTVLFELFYLVKYEDYIFYVITKLPNKQFYLYLFCGIKCHWMPPVVFNTIWPIVRKNIRKIMREVLNIDIKEEIPNQNENIQTQTQKLTQFEEESIMKGVITTLCWWPKYISNAYLLPNIHTEQYSYNWTSGHVHIFPKPTLLPNKIHVRKPEDIKNIPEGVYPVIRYHPYGNMQIVFAISSDTEVVFHDSPTFKEIKEDVYAEPLKIYGLDLIAIQNGFIKRYNIVNFNKKWDKQKHIPTYWKGVYSGASIFYLPEVVFRHLMGEEIEPKQEPFAREIISNIQFKKGKYYQWLKSIVEKYKNIPISSDLKIIGGFLDLHGMFGNWYVLKWERNIDGNYETDAIVIVNMIEPNKIFKVIIPWRFLRRIVHRDLKFITVWPDGTIGWWDLIH